MANAEASNSQPRPLTSQAFAITLLIVALWGGNSVAVRFSVASIPPVAVACARFAIGTLVLGVWYLSRRESLRINRGELVASWIAGILLFLQISTFNVGVLWSNSTHGAMFINTFPFFVVLIEHWVTKSDRITLRKTIGMLLAAAGVSAVMLDAGGGEGQRNTLFAAGDVVLLLSSILLSIRVVYVGRLVRRMPPGKLIFWSNMVGVMLFAGWSLVTEDLSEMTLERPAVLGLLYQGGIISGFCFVTHATLLRTYSASQISVFSFATPIFGVLFSIWLLHEPFTTMVTLGAILVAGGIWAVNYK